MSEPAQKCITLFEDIFSLKRYDKFLDIVLNNSSLIKKFSSDKAKAMLQECFDPWQEAHQAYQPVHAGVVEQRFGGPEEHAGPDALRTRETEIEKEIPREMYLVSSIVNPGTKGDLGPLKAMLLEQQIKATRPLTQDGATRNVNTDGKNRMLHADPGLLKESNRAYVSGHSPVQRPPGVDMEDIGEAFDFFDWMERPKENEEGCGVLVTFDLGQSSATKIMKNDLAALVGEKRVVPVDLEPSQEDQEMRQEAYDNRRSSNPDKKRPKTARAFGECGKYPGRETMLVGFGCKPPGAKEHKYLPKNQGNSASPKLDIPLPPPEVLGPRLTMKLKKDILAPDADGNGPKVKRDGPNEGKVAIKNCDIPDSTMVILCHFDRHVKMYMNLLFTLACSSVWAET